MEDFGDDASRFAATLDFGLDPESNRGFNFGSGYGVVSGLRLGIASGSGFEGASSSGLAPDNGSGANFGGASGSGLKPDNGSGAGSGGTPGSGLVPGNGSGDGFGAGFTLSNVSESSSGLGLATGSGSGLGLASGQGIGGNSGGFATGSGSGLVSGPDVGANTPYAPVIPAPTPAERPPKLSGADFKRWSQKMLFYLTTLNLARFLREDPPSLPEEDVVDQNRRREYDACHHCDFLCPQSGISFPKPSRDF